MRFVERYKQLFPALLFALLLPTLAVPGFARNEADWVRVMNLKGEWKFSIGDDMRWAAAAFDDRKWENIRVPATWEDEGFHGYDGYAWYRKSFDGQELAGQSVLYLGLGYIDDVDEVYVNGRLVGFSGSFPPRFYTAYKAHRMYPVPAEYLNPTGKNVIAVRVYDAYLEGGIIAGDIGFFRKKEGPELLINLEGVWRFRTGNHPNWAAADFDDRKWATVMVPSFWEDQGYDYDGIAWYRKGFFVPKSLGGQELVLLLGKIDDFDLAYLNGAFMGSTNDGRRFGSSQSWLRERVYSIPPGALKFGEVNYLAVQVKDMGVGGGIYQGPVGIARKDRN